MCVCVCVCVFGSWDFLMIFFLKLQIMFVRSCLFCFFVCSIRFKVWMIVYVTDSVCMVLFKCEWMIVYITDTVCIIVLFKCEWMIVYITYSVCIHGPVLRLFVCWIKRFQVLSLCLEAQLLFARRRHPWSLCQSNWTPSVRIHRLVWRTNQGFLCQGNWMWSASLHW